MKKMVLVTGNLSSPKHLVELRKMQFKLRDNQVPVCSILDFAKEGDNAPNFHQMMEIQNFFALNVKYLVIGDISDENAINNRLISIAEKFGVKVINFRDIVLTGSNPFKKSFIERIDEVLKPWFTNPMKRMS
jgi:hypothetical protein